MDWERRCIRMCAAVLLCAVVLRLWSAGALAPVGQALSRSETASFLLYLHTGRVVRSLPEQDWEELPPASQPALRDQVQKQTFRAADAALVAIDDTCGKAPDAAALLTAELDLDLTGPGPKVLILHTHTTESFTQTADRYEESSPYRTLDAGHNMIALGKIVADILREAGVEVIHDTTLHDYPSYNGSYSHAAAAAKAYLEQYPSIGLILDLHRDAADTPTGQLATRCTVGGEKSAQLMFVVGTDTRLNHPDWEKNMSLALKLQVLLEQDNPGICRNMNLTKNRYNQHLGNYALLVEIGAAGNTLEEAKRAARELGEAIVCFVNSEE